MLHRIERTSVQPVGKWIIGQPVHEAQNARIVHVFPAITIECTQIVRVAQLAAEFLEDLPVPVACGRAMFDTDMDIEISLHTIVVQKRVIHVE